jgi:hypothetical protein
MSSRPLFVKRSRLNHRVILWASLLLVLVLAVSVLTGKRQDDLDFWRLPVRPNAIVVVTAIPDRMQDGPSDKTKMLVPSDVPAVALSVLAPPPEKALTVADALKDQQLADDKLVALKAALDRWSKAWRNQDVPTYLSMYASDFMTPHGMDRVTWSKVRSARIMGKRKIRHEMRDLKIEPERFGATVRFTQVYADERLHITDRKTMKWVDRDRRWLITQEVAD